MLAGSPLIKKTSENSRISAFSSFFHRILTPLLGAVSQTHSVTVISNTPVCALLCGCVSCHNRPTPKSIPSCNVPLRDVFRTATDVRFYFSAHISPSFTTNVVDSPLATSGGGGGGGGAEEEECILTEYKYMSASAL